MSTPAQFARYHRLVQVLADLARSSRDVGAVVQTVHRQAETLFSTHVTLLALLASPEEWVWELYEGRQHTTSRLPFYEEGVVEQALGGPLSIPDLTAYLTEFPVRVRRVLSAEEVVLDVREIEDEAESVHALLLVPLEIGGKRVGVLSIQSYRVHAFDETDLLFLELLGQHVAIALENARWHAQLERATLTDPLTGLPNRRAFGARAERALGAAQTGEAAPTLVLLDIERFKGINDTFGHDVGDEVLVTVAEVLGRALPPGAAFRLGGDEFALLVEGDRGEVGREVERLNAALREARWPPGVGPVCLNAGAARARPGDSLSVWLRRADQRMYHAKRGCADRAGTRWGLDFGPLDLGPLDLGPAPG
ncbi:GGDEF domain-containing protein [Deinococcus planocerae]|uniref:GGDEF domain-containing protein n=1 Tax=Deinococcus planocerae TaxID=1737569 RepID=UPI000C7F6BEF|nr:sensor domain-containing diguanylate cyclase [Deinococcus planocerae]